MMYIVHTTSIAQGECLSCRWINLVSRTWMMCRQLRTVSTSCGVDDIWRTTQVTLEWSARVTARYSEKRIQSPSSLLLCF